MGHGEPFWRSNTSFSPPISRRWDQRFQTELLSNESVGDVGIALSSLSSNSKGSRTWVRGEQLPRHNYSSSDGAMSYLSDPYDIFHSQQLPPPSLHGNHTNEYASATIRDTLSGPLPVPELAEGTSQMPNRVGSNSSCSDGSEYEGMSKFHVNAHRNFTRRSFMSKPVYPVSFPDQTPEVEEVSGSLSATNSNRAFISEPQYFSRFLDSSNHQRDPLGWSSGSSVDFTDVSEQMEHEFAGFSANSISDGSKCGLCERHLSQRSPWGSRRIIRSGDMPIAGVLSCWHVYHAECLERITPKTCINDPPCPLCERTVDGAHEQRVISKMRIGMPRLRSLGEEGQSRSWSCVQVGDCVEGALHASPRKNALPRQGRLKRHLSLKGSPVKEMTEKSKGGMCSSRGSRRVKLVDHDAAGSSKTPTSSLKRW